MNRLSWTAAAVAIGLAGCEGPGPTEADNGTLAPTENMASNAVGDEAAARRAIATLQTAEGAPAGTATVTAGAGEAGIMISLNVQGLPAGEHGAHVHMTGQCDAPNFESAGSHWNPTDAQHGLENPQGQHAGDMPNLTVNEDGSGSLEYTLEGGSFEGLLDADGSAMVVHASADDQTTDPSGNSGGRIACGVFEES